MAAVYFLQLVLQVHRVLLMLPMLTAAGREAYACASEVLICLVTSRVAGPGTMS